MSVILMFSTCREQEQFDITGTWHFYEFRDNGSQFDLYRTFVGTRMRGELDPGSVSGVSGEYTVSGHRVFIKVMAGRGIAWNIHEYTGRFDSIDYMRGALIGEHREVGVVTLTWSGTWVEDNGDGSIFALGFKKQSSPYRKGGQKDEW